MSFPQIPRQVIVGLFYAVPLLLLLEMNLKPKARVNYSTYDSLFAISDKRIKAYNDEIISYSRKYMNKVGSHTEGLKYSLQIDSIVIRSYIKVGKIKQRLIEESGIQSLEKQRSLMFPDYNKALKNNFINNNSADTIQRLIDSTIEQLMTFIPLYDTPIYRKLVNYQWFPNSIEEYRNSDYKFDDHWCSKIFEQENMDGVLVLLSMIQNNLLVTEHLFLTRIIEIYRFRYGGFDHLGAVFIPGQPFALKNSLMKAYALFADYGCQNYNFTFQADEGKFGTHAINCVGALTITTKGLGLHTVHGTDTNKTDDSIRVYPWSFSYFVAAPGAALELDSLEILYRGIANSVTISVPGYPLSEISLRVPGATIKKIADGQYEIIVSEKAPKKLTAYTDATNNKGITSTVNITELKVKDLPPPECLLNGLKNDTLSLDDFQSHAELSIRFADSDFIVKYNLVKYSVSLRKSNQQCIGPIECTNPILAKNEALSELLNQVENGDRIYINDVLVNSEGRKNIEAMPATVLLKRL